jgi:hypothetical protein
MDQYQADQGYGKQDDGYPGFILHIASESSDKID